MRLVFLFASAVYGTAITAWLSVPDIARAIGLEGLSGFPWKDYGLRFSAFGLLAVLAHASRWPKRFAWRMLILVAYALSIGGIENYVSSRSIALDALLADLAGIAAGSALYWAACRLAKPRRTRSDRHAVLREYLALQRMHEQPPTRP
jgi:hypothetical protein